MTKPKDWTGRPQETAHELHNRLMLRLDGLLLPNSPDLKADLNNLLRQTEVEAWERAHALVEHSDKREHFLDYVLNGALHYSWWTVVEHDPGFMPETWPSFVNREAYRPASASVIETGEDGLTEQDLEDRLGGPDHHDVDHATIELGLQRIRLAKNIPDQGTGNWERNMTSIPHLSQYRRDFIIKHDLQNDAGQLDVNDYDTILQVALLNEVRYA